MIWVDIDGVVLDLISTLSDRLSKNPMFITGKESYDLGRRFGCETDAVWKSLQSMTTEDWSLAHKYKHADYFLIRLLTIGDVSFLSALGKGIQAPIKDAWRQKHYPDIPVIYVRESSDKKCYIQKGDVLIDDFDDNINDCNSVGGRGVLVPRMWNSGFDEMPLLTERQGLDYIVAAVRERIR